jgi:hypothetical protein
MTEEGDQAAGGARSAPVAMVARDTSGLLLDASKLLLFPTLSLGTTHGLHCFSLPAGFNFPFTWLSLNSKYS